MDNAKKKLKQGNKKGGRGSVESHGKRMGRGRGGRETLIKEETEAKQTREEKTETKGGELKRKERGKVSVKEIWKK